MNAYTRLREEYVFDCKGSFCPEVPLAGWLRVETCLEGFSCLHLYKFDYGVKAFTDVLI